MRKSLSILLLVLVGAMVVGGCGQSGATEAEQKQAQEDQTKSPDVQ